MSNDQTLQNPPVKKERNYTIEFFRFIFAISFLLIHVYAVLPMVVGVDAPFVSTFDTIIPFMAFAGFFLMQSFEKSRKRGTTDSPARQAWLYLKGRIIGLGPVFVFSTLIGGIGFLLIAGIPPIAWPIYFINIICEFFGICITGYGYGNNFIGTAAVRGISGSLANGPLWFMSGIFVCGYLIYYLLAKHRDTFLGLIAPFSILLYYGSCYMTDTLPMWITAHNLGDFQIASGFLNMFCGMSIGVIMYVMVDAVKDKEWSKGFKRFLGVVQCILTVLVMVRTWISATHPINQLLGYGWGVAFLLSTIFTFLCVFNQDSFTRCKLFANKIWAVPGRLAMYVYMIHYPIILFVTRAFGVTAGSGSGEKYLANIHIIFVISLVISLVAGYGVMKFDQNVIAPWLKTKPWFSKAQREIEKQSAAK